VLLRLFIENEGEGSSRQFFSFGNYGYENDKQKPQAKKIQVEQRNAEPHDCPAEECQQRVIDRQAAENKKHQ
jgi:hypothetical protein